LEERKNIPPTRIHSRPDMMKMKKKKKIVALFGMGLVNLPR